MSSLVLVVVFRLQKRLKRFIDMRYHINLLVNCIFFSSKSLMTFLSPPPMQIIRSNHTLAIFDANPADSATYTCEADNGYDRASDSATITVENIYIEQVRLGDRESLSRFRFQEKKL